MQDFRQHRSVNELIKSHLKGSISISSLGSVHAEKFGIIDSDIKKNQAEFIQKN